MNLPLKVISACIRYSTCSYTNYLLTYFYTSLLSVTRKSRGGVLQSLSVLHPKLGCTVEAGAIC